jgi:hypothetical protein
MISLLKQFTGIFILAIIVFATFSMAVSEDWIVYVNNKPFKGSVSVSKDIVMVSVEELSQMLKFSYDYNKLTNYLKINDAVYSGPRNVNNGKLFVSLGDVSGMVGAKYSMDPKAFTVTVQTFSTKLVPVSTPPPVGATPAPVASKGDEVKVQGLTQMGQNDLNQGDILSTGVKGEVLNTVKAAANKVVVTVSVKDGNGKVQQTLTKNVGTLKGGEKQSFQLFFHDPSKYQDPTNPAIIRPGVIWSYEGKVTFELEKTPTPTPTQK